MIYKILVIIANFISVNFADSGTTILDDIAGRFSQD